MQEYKVYFDKDEIGTAKVIQEGLYYRITCRCRINPGIHKLYADSEKGRMLVGVFCPHNDWFEIERQISIKSLGMCINSFCVDRSNDSSNTCYDICENQPFQQLHQLGNGYLVKESGCWKICVR